MTELNTLLVPLTLTLKVSWNMFFQLSSFSHGTQKKICWDILQNI